jgi:DNA-binding NarL/FixJ family response regulator
MTGALACSAAARGAANRAAKLFGAVETLYEAVSYDESSADRGLRAQYVESARSRLDEGVWEAAFTDGKIMGLEEAIEYALSEERPATPMPQAVEPSTDRAQRRTLTHREEEIAALVARGLTNRQIASELVISERTVDHHVGSILKKLNLHSREQVATPMTEH